MHQASTHVLAHKFPATLWAHHRVPYSVPLRTFVTHVIVETHPVNAAQWAVLTNHSICMLARALARWRQKSELATNSVYVCVCSAPS